MIGKSLWQQLKDVVDCDRTISSLQNEQTSIKQGLEKDRSSLAGQDVGLNKTKQVLFTLQKDAKLNELSITELKEKEDHKRKQLESVSGQKEYMALEKEIASLARQRQGLEETVEKQWYSIETLKTEVESEQTHSTDHTTHLTHDIAAKQNILTDLEAKLQQAIASKDAAFKQLPAEWQTQFSRMKNSIADPIVPVLDTSCSGCFYSIPHHELSKLKKGSVIVCRSCYRFLYFDQGATDAEKKAEY